MFAKESHYVGTHYMHEAKLKSVPACACVLLLCFCETHQSNCVGVFSSKKSPLKDKRAERKDMGRRTGEKKGM